MRCGKENEEVKPVIDCLNAPHKKKESGKGDKFKPHSKVEMASETHQQISNECVK